MKTGPGYRYKLVGSEARRKTSHDIFDGTLQKTQIWLNDFMTELDWQEHPHKAYLALRTVLHALRDRLTSRRGGTVGRPTAHAGAGLLLRRLDAQGKTAQGTPQRRFPRAYQRRFQGRLHVAAGKHRAGSLQGAGAPHQRRRDRRHQAYFAQGVTRAVAVEACYGVRERQTALIQ